MTKSTYSEAKSANFVPDYNGFKVAIEANNKGHNFFERSFKMARFPLKEAEVIALAQSMVSGLTANAAVYPARGTDLRQE